MTTPLKNLITEVSFDEMFALATAKPAPLPKKKSKRKNDYASFCDMYATQAVSHVTTEETVDREALVGLLERSDAVAEICASASTAQGKPTVLNAAYRKMIATTLRDLLDAVDEDGHHIVHYGYSEELRKANVPSGRLYACGPSLQTLPGPIRATLAHTRYTDVDQVNAHPTIIRETSSRYYESKGVPKNPMPLLGAYVDYRERVIALCLEELELAGVTHDAETGAKIDRGWVKTQMLAVLNGGALDCQRGATRPLARVHQELSKFSEEFSLTLEHLRAVTEAKTDAYASVAHRMMIAYVNDVENRVLQTAVTHLTDTHGLSVGTLIFDGCLVEGPVTDEIVAELADVCARANLPRVTWLIKPWKNVIEWQGLPLNKPAVDSADVSESPDEESLETPLTPSVVNFQTSTWTYEDLRAEVESQIFPSEGELRRYLDEKLPGALAYINDGQGYFVKRKSAALIDTFTRLDLVGVSIWCRWLEGKKTRGTKLATLCTGEAWRHIPRFIARDYYADASECPGDVLNMMPLRRATPRANLQLVEPICEILRDVWADGDLNTYRWIVAWLRCVVCTGRLPQTAIFLQGQEGSGKGTIVDFLIEWVFGTALACTFSGVKALVEKHNVLHAGKRFVYVNEMSSATPQLIAEFDDVKDLITGQTLHINPKNFAAQVVRNNAAYIFCSNHEDALPLTATSRRYTALRTSSRYCGPEHTAFWVNKRAQIYTQATADAFVSWLDGLDPRDWPNPSVAHVTEFTQELRADGEKPAVRFMREVLEDELALEMGRREWTTSELVERFRSWDMPPGQYRKDSNVHFARAIHTAQRMRALPAEFIEVKLQGRSAFRWVPGTTQAPIPPPEPIAENPRVSPPAPKYRRAARKTFPGVTPPSEEFVDAAVRALCPSD